MAQEIRNRRGDLVISIPDGVVLMPSDPTVSSDGPTLPNTNTSLFQVGRDVLDYGLEISENLHWIMENFANSVPPQNPVDGQLWWDISSAASPVMKVYNTGTGGWGAVVKLSSDPNPSLSANLNAAGRKIINLGAPVSAADAATKQYVDSAIGAISGGVNSFLSLSDTPSTYSGQAGKVTRVNAANTGLEFYKLKFTDLDGVSSSFAGQNSKYLRVNTSGTAIEYVTPSITHIDWSGAVNVNAQGVKISNIATPTAGQDAATKSYVDSALSSATGGILPPGNGIVVRTNSGSVNRNITAGNNGIVIQNGDGVAGNITISHGAATGNGSVNSGGTVIQSITLDPYGHISTIGTTSITGGLGYIPVNKAGDTMSGNLNVSGGGHITLSTNGDITAHRGNNTGVIFLGNAGNRYLYFDGSNYQMPSSNLYVNGGLAWTSVNQGSGTGMNSDLLDGYDWTSGQFVSFGQGRFLTPNSGTTGGIQLRANPSHGNAILQFVNADVNQQYGFLSVNSNGRLIYNNGTVWHSLLQGPGTGMNADLLDGYHYSDIIANAAAAGGGIIAGSLGANGWVRFGFSNFMIQWGYYNATSGGYKNIYFPTSFPTACRSVTLGSEMQANNDSTDDVAGVSSVTQSYFQARTRGSLHFYWMAIGY
ncbi:MAG: hypothetical protein M0R77_20345 [Gammaproteobacteria bacterium]|nr:hypothetical protein [Gammaproteobacteria bacterium]